MEPEKNSTKELNELRNKFVQIVSHQLRTPLNSIRWSLEMLLNGSFGPLKPEQREFLRITHQADVEIIKRINDMITAIDIEEKKVGLNREEIPIESLWGSVMVGWKTKCDLKNITCEYHAPQQPLPTVSCDAEKIREVLTHLTDNAVVYTPENGRVSATLRPIDGKIRFEITDTGIGIPESEQSKIFNRFYRATNAPSMKTDTSGVGLFIAKYFVEQHGGQIGFTSTEGKGSTFWFEIPLIEESP